MSELLAKIFIIVIMNTAIVLLWFDFNLGLRLKTILGYDPTKHTKPFDCMFCTSFWIGISSVVYFSFKHQNWAGSLLLLVLSYIASRILDKLWE